MKKGIIIGLVILAGVIILPVIYAIATYNSAVQQENGIVAVNEDMKNVHASIFNDLKSQGLSVEKYGDTVMKAINAAMTGRYGNDGVHGAMVWIQEQNPTIDPGMYQKLQTVIEAGYNRFEATQRSKIDRLRIYDNFIGSFPSGFVAKIFGFPKKVTDDMRQTISTAETEEMMKTKQMKTIDPFSR